MAENTQVVSKLDYYTLRKLTGLSQERFWGKLGVSQSAGSRYEANYRKVPKSVVQLVRLYYVLNFKEACAELKGKRLGVDSVTSYNV